MGMVKLYLIEIKMRLSSALIAVPIIQLKKDSELAEIGLEF